MKQTEETVQRARNDPYRSYTIYQKSVKMDVIFSEPYFFVFERDTYYWRDEARMILSFNRLTLQWSLYVKDFMNLSTFKQICSVLGVKRPPLKLHQFKLMDIMPNAMEFPLQKHKRPRKTAYYPDGHYNNRVDIKTNITPEHLDGYTVLDTTDIKIFGNKITHFNGDYKLLNHYICDAFNGKLILPNGDEVSLRNARGDWHRYFLVKTKSIGEHNVEYPVKIDGTPIKDEKELDVFWDRRARHTKIYREICKDNIEIPEDFDLERFEYHFYGKSMKQTKVYAYLKAEVNGGCQCDRCRGYRIFVAEKHKIPYFRGWDKDHYKMIHAAIKGNIPDKFEMIVDCDCKACQAFRNTIKRKVYIQRDAYNDTLQIKLEFDYNKILYLTAGWRADICVRPDEMTKETDVNDFHWRYAKKHFNKFKEDVEELPIDFSGLDFRYQLAYNHLRLNNVPWKDVPQKAEEWLMKVFTTMLKPDCTCEICNVIKTIPEAPMRFYDELLLERVDQRAYPTALVSIHFTGNTRGWHYGRHKYKREEIFDYFQKYVLYGKYCECDNCKKFRERMERDKYLPRNELVAPKCPLCGNSVHKKDLIYLNSEIAEKIVTQGYDKLIGVQTALCCSCHGQWMANVKRKTLLFELKKGEYINISDKPARIRAKKYIKLNDEWVEFTKKADFEQFEEMKMEEIEKQYEFKEDLYIVIKHGEGELAQEEWIDFNTFAGKDYDFKLPKRLEDQIHRR